MLKHWFVQLILRTKGLTWNMLYEILQKKPREVVKVEPRKPPDKKNMSKRRLRRLGLLAAINTIQKLPTFYTTDNHITKDYLKNYKYKSYTETPERMQARVQRSIENSTIENMVDIHEMFEVIVDTGCSTTTTPYMEDFIPGTYQKLEKPLNIEGVAGKMISVTNMGMVRWECITENGNKVKLHHMAHHAPELGKIRLLSPQILLKSIKGRGEFTINNKRGKFIINNEIINTPISELTSLPMLTCFNNLDETAKKLANKHSLLSPENGNLTVLQKELLKWHYKLGHVRMTVVQWIGRHGILGKFGFQWGKSTLKPPICEGCQLGKASRIPRKGHHTEREDEGILYKDKCEPGDMVFSDQYVCEMKGRYHNNKGQINSNYEYRGGTVFVDAASGYIYLQNQVGFTAYETIESKLKFEREAASAGVQVKRYTTDNGVYTAREFQKELAQKGQILQLSGVGGHHHNAPAENAIKIVMNRARTIMFHAALCWPEQMDFSLWPLALQHSMQLYNETPNPKTGMAPIEIWTKTKSSYSTLINAQPWGCPVYVLDPALQDGRKIPKWNPRSRMGQYVGDSPMHASTVGLIRNLKTQNISPQYHVVYDSFFETVHGDSITDDTVWDELVIFNRFRSNYDETECVPELSDEWLSQEELIQKHHEASNTKTRLQEPQAEVKPQQQREPGPSRQADIKEETTTTENVKDEEQQVVGQPETSGSPSSTGPRRSTRERRPPTRFTFDKQHGYKAVKSYLHRVYHGTGLGNGYDNEIQYILALLLDPQVGIFDYIPLSAFTNSPKIYKAGGSRDKDTPNFQEAMFGPYRSEFIQAMAKEISELEEHGTWKVVSRRSLPEGANILPSTWAFKIKRTPFGEIKKFKARFCVRGDKQIEGVDYFESYAPVVAWSTVRMILCLAIQQGWATKMVDFSNAFVQAELNEDVYITLPAMFMDESGEENKSLCLKLVKSLYGLVQAPRYWYLKLASTLNELGLEASVSEPGVFYG
jgi:hypothetical protein